MYVEPSAILAIMKEEPEAPALRRRLAAAPRKVISVVGKVEAAISLGRFMQNYDLGAVLVSEFCEQAGIEIVSVHPELFSEVMNAYRRFGKGTGHPAKLNFGDCISYGYAKRHGLPLLFKGNDFPMTDVDAAL